MKVDGPEKPRYRGGDWFSPKRIIADKSVLGEESDAALRFVPDIRSHFSLFFLGWGRGDMDSFRLGEAGREGSLASLIDEFSNLKRLFLPINLKIAFSFSNDCPER
jgi:hypothetical protein